MLYGTITSAQDTITQSLTPASEQQEQTGTNYVAGMGRAKQNKKAQVTNPARKDSAVQKAIKQSLGLHGSLHAAFNTKVGGNPKVL